MGDDSMTRSDAASLARREVKALSTDLSVAQVLANLEKQLASHKEQERHHAEREAFHREQRAVHAAEIETVGKHYEAFKATAEGAATIAARTATPAPPKQGMPAPPVRVEPVRPHKLVARLISELPQGTSLTASTVAAEVNRRYRSELKKLIDRPVASVCLRRMAADGRIRLVKKGTAHIPAVYAKP
jgi:hypothetical protein